MFMIFEKLVSLYYIRERGIECSGIVCWRNLRRSEFRGGEVRPPSIGLGAWPECRQLGRASNRKDESE